MAYSDFTLRQLIQLFPLTRSIDAADYCFKDVNKIMGILLTLATGGQFPVHLS